MTDYLPWFWKLRPKEMQRVSSGTKRATLHERTSREERYWTWTRTCGTMGIMA